MKRIVSVIILTVLLFTASGALNVAATCDCNIDEQIYVDAKTETFYVINLKGIGAPKYTKIANSSFATQFPPSSINMVGPNYEKAFYLGDANGDGKVNVLDSTFIQKSLVGLVVFPSLKKMAAADVDFSEGINVKDATIIQKHIAGIV